MTGFLIALIVVVVVFLMMGVRVVRQGYVYTVERLASSRSPQDPACTSSSPSSTGSARR